MHTSSNTCYWCTNSEKSFDRKDTVPKWISFSWKKLGESVFVNLKNCLKLMKYLGQQGVPHVFLFLVWSLISTVESSFSQSWVPLGITLKKEFHHTQGALIAES